MRMRLFPVLLGLLLWPLTVWSTTYYATPGGSGCSTNRNSPGSFTGGMGCLSPGDTLYLRSGTYTANGISGNPGGNSGARVTVAGDPQDPPRSVQLNIGPTNSVNGIAFGGGSSWSTWDNLVFDCLNSVDFAHGLKFTGATDFTLKNSEIRNCLYTGISTISPSTRLLFQNLNVHHNGTDPNRDHGFYITTPNVIIENSDIHHNKSLGIHAYHEPFDDINHDNIYRGNYVHDNGCGILMSSGQNQKSYNNLVVNNTSCAFITYSAPTSLILNNTIYGNSGDAFDFREGADATVCNNIVVNNGNNSTSGATSASSNITSGSVAFVNANANDFHLTGSATNAINQGTNGCQVATYVTKDKDGNTRPISGAWDIGAYEFGGSGQPTGVFYVNTNGGLDANPCTANSPNIAKKTIANAITNCIRTPNDVLYIRSGVYNERLSGLTWPSGTSFSVPITIAGFAGETVIIKAPAGGSGAMVNVTGASYLIFDNLTLDATDYATDSSHHAMLLGPGTHHIRVQNSHIQSARGFTSPNASKGIVLDPASTNNELLGLDVHHHLGDGIDIPSSNNLVQASNIHDNARSGLRLSSGGSATANTIRANRLYTNGDNSINCAGGCAYPGLAIDSGTQTLVANNLVYQNANGGLLLAGTNQTIYNNTVSNNLSTGACIGGAGSGHTIRNNICWQNGADITAPGSIAPNLTLSDPLFLNAPGGDFHLQPGSPAIDTGATIAAVTNDVYGTPRPQPVGGAYDMGAVEQSVTPVAGLLAYWPFDAGTGTTAADATNNGHTLTLNGGATWGAGKLGAGSLSLSGDGQYATMANPFQLAQYTWAMWVNLTNAPLTTGYQVCFTYGGGADQLSFTWSQPTVGRQKGAIHRDTSGSYQIAAIPDTMNANTWYHVAGTHDGSTLRVYLNGLLKASTAVGAMFPGGTGDFRIGQFTTEGCPGRIDDFRWYDRPLNETDIQALASGSGTSTPLVVRHRALVR